MKSKGLQKSKFFYSLVNFIFKKPIFHLFHELRKTDSNIGKLQNLFVKCEKLGSKARPTLKNLKVESMDV